MPMRFVKKIVFVLLLLIIAFFVYRLISPNSANNLLLDIKTFSNTSFGTHFDLSGTILETSGVVLDTTWTVLDASGVSLLTTGQENTGDELLLSDVELSTGQTTIPATGTIVSSWATVITSAPVVVPVVKKTPTKAPAKPVPTSSSSSDYKNLLENFSN